MDDFGDPNPKSSYLDGTDQGKFRLERMMGSVMKNASRASSLIHWLLEFRLEW